jgi:uncharacterized membrane protein YjgN (DUF898 family)
MQSADMAAPEARHIPDTHFAPDTVVDLPPSTHMMAIRFTGSGSEYFRIWIVNLLLMLVTLGIYFSWAKVRRLRYFMGNTLVDGQPLGFHGDPKKMLKGYMLVGVLFGLYSLAGELSPVAGLVAFILVAGLWPALFKSSLQFRMANTSWRGLRLRFHGDLRGAYRAMLPLFVPGLVVVAGLVFVPNREVPPVWYGALSGLVGLSTLAVAPWLFWNIKQYQHKHYGLGHLQTDFRASVGSFYGLGLKIFGMVVLAIGVPAGLIVAAIFGLVGPQGGMASKGGAVALFMVLPALLGMLALLVCIKPYSVARLQNLVWTKTGNSDLRFVSTLRVRSLLWLTIKNWFFILITLGLYWPFAAVAMARLRLEAVSIKSRVNPELLIAQVHPQEGDAAGEAAGDFFGMDIGL